MDANGNKRVAGKCLLRAPCKVYKTHVDLLKVFFVANQVRVCISATATLVALDLMVFVGSLAKDDMSLSDFEADERGATDGMLQRFSDQVRLAHLFKQQQVTSGHHAQCDISVCCISSCPGPDRSSSSASRDGHVSLVKKSD